MRLTERVIDRLTPPTSGYLIAWDEDLKGFGVRVTAAGAKSFIVNYRTRDGRQRRATVGRFPATSATAARLRAQELLAGIMLGSDPVKQEQERRSEITLGELVNKYEEEHLSELSSGDEVVRYLRSDVLPCLGRNKKVSAVTRRAIKDMVKAKARRAPVASNRLLTHVKGMFAWGVDEEYIQGDPAAGIKRLGAEETPRTRFLSEEEIWKVWDALPTAKRMSNSVRSVLRLILVTGQRPGEVAGMRWDEIDTKSGWWVLPAERTKAGREHHVPLSRLALAELETRGKRDEWVFPGTAGHISRLALSHAVRRNREHFGIPAWTPHDLRRTATTHLAKLKVDRLIIKLILNHSDKSVTAAYDQHSYEDEKREALARWGHNLQQSISGEAPAKVVAIDG